MATNTTQSSSAATKSSSSPAKRARASSRKPVARKRRSTARSRKTARSNSRFNGSTTSQFLRHGKEAVTGAYDQALSATRSLRDSKMGSRLVDRRKSITTVIEENPLVLGAVGLGIGMVLGAMMPHVDMRSVGLTGRSGQNRSGKIGGRGSRSR